MAEERVRSNAVEQGNSRRVRLAGGNEPDGIAVRGPVRRAIRSSEVRAVRSAERERQAACVCGVAALLVERRPAPPSAESVEPRDGALDSVGIGDA